MAELWLRPRELMNPERVADNNPLPVRITEDSMDLYSLPPVAGRAVFRQVVVPGITTGAAYADLDSLGTVMRFPNVFRAEKKSGYLMSAFYFDMDDEGLAVDLHFFSRQIAQPGADNAAMAVTDAEMLAFRGSLRFTAFSDFNLNQTSQAVGVGLHLFSESVDLYAQAQARGVLNIAAENLPRFAICVIPD